jgi:hypothetical protein
MLSAWDVYRWKAPEFLMLFTLHNGILGLWMAAFFILHIFSHDLDDSRLELAYTAASDDSVSSAMSRKPRGSWLLLLTHRRIQEV